MKKQYTLSIFTENKIGLLNRITIIFTRRHLNIERITVSESEVKDVYRFTVVVNSTKERVDKALGQIEKQIEVLKGFVHEEEEVIYQELALYKMSTKTFTNTELEKIVKENGVRVLVKESEYVVLEKTGHKEETQELLEKLQVYGVLEFSRSGRVAVTKPMKELKTYLKELEII
jgi:acetolactate synthase-1/3 small subunit